MVLDDAASGIAVAATGVSTTSVVSGDDGCLGRLTLFPRPAGNGAGCADALDDDDALAGADADFEAS
jgi:hypothetical protein